MAHYVIGDLQGCYTQFKQLLALVDFNPSKDHLYLVGDLVARGPDSLACMQYVYSLQSSVTVTLGNHDLHLMSTVLNAKKANPKDKLDALISSTSLTKYLTFLQSQPLCTYLPEFDCFISHAGIHPHWNIEQAIKLSKWGQSCYRGANSAQFLADMYGKNSNIDLPDDDPQIKFNTIVNVFTRMRFLTPNWLLDFDNKGTLKDSEQLQPWFTHPRFKTSQTRFIFGHWAALEGKTSLDQVIALDTGCVWGGPMTLLNLSTNEQITSN
ncbi:symmetrical bis(5'-nucleosyl)-tetraphosphatase [Pseudoalteromonas luteoviolacea]|uniref:symmetrical bis(5'-nucleosyl)-tetraphosphatase n=1 Tax=Pseudoalteromonas luteoviolacea TaxID=43657 RepID=UPI001B39D121|nr:symmetrical bis(5'-nucleosyl)-tetraphosphatase [Pseudoalteromonas luteoviolacea]MBQ4877591.1 symmetrical bis(5'-nucleosyl)-tetraphosphatase [Pseudoalteromonas luteoviolacea]MBQ4906626.1 symmetrical bis(5'-nucleosyl)-tetraphosphatase [Pseudoalteromonas luteoviolacea]